jgi:cytochrome c553
MKRQTLGAILLMMALPGAANAGDVAAGKAKSVTCVGCHGTAGVSANPMWPNLAGQQEQYLAKQMRDFRSGERKDPVMGPMSMALSDEDINNLAAYYASLK